MLEDHFMAALVKDDWRVAMGANVFTSRESCSIPMQ